MRSVPEQAGIVKDFQPDEHQLLELEISEVPTCTREDVARLNFVCDENGDLQDLATAERNGTFDKRGTLESRGVTSQAELWSAATAHKLSVVSKLLSVGRLDLSGPLAECHTVETCRVCNGCKRVSVYFNRCERHYCPECAPRLARERRESVEWWAKEIGEPKHVVLTVRNSDDFTKAHVQWFKQCWSKLRRRRFARGWRGGFYRLEVTKEKRGWHLHLHALIDAGWIDARALAVEWAKIVGQDFAIVKVKDVHDRSYLAEVTKYTVKGSQLATWTGEEIAEFIDAFDGVRTFGVFGSLYGKRTEFREWIETLQAGKVACSCGCNDFRILSPNELAWSRLQAEGCISASRPMPPPEEPDLPNLPNVEGRPPSLDFLRR